MFTVVLGLLCAVYGTVLIFITGFWEWENYVWYVFALFFFGMNRIGLLYTKGKVPLWSLVSGYTLAGLGIVIFSVTLVIVNISLPGEDERGLDFLIVLGSKPDVYKEGSEISYRLDKAMEYIEENPDTELILSGGLSYGGRSEAVIMADYLVEKGMAPENILLEMESRNTRENLLYAKALMEKYITDRQIDMDIVIVKDIGPVLVVEDRPKKVGILTNDFHVFRAMQVAKSLGYEQVYPVSAKSNGILYIHMIMRETFAILKYKFLGYI